jgi:hypothetical protein
MATTDQELKTLNKTVGEAVNILKLYVGNSANIKAMNEQQKEVWKKFMAVEDLAEENQKRQRAFTERQRDENGKFIKKREGSWGKFLGMAEGTFKGLDKVTGGIAGKFKSMIGIVTDKFGRLFSEIKSHFLGLFGEEGEWFAMMGAIKDSVVNAWKGMWNFIFKTPKWAKKQIKILSGLYDMISRQIKAGIAKGTKVAKKGGAGLLEILGFALAGLAMGIGAWVRSKLIALEAIMKLPSLKKMFDSIKLAWLKKFEKLKKIPFLGKFIEIVGKFGKRFGMLFKAFKFGFKVLGLPLTILLGVIDFVKGFMNTEGTLFDKIKGGLWEAIEGFIELPVKFVGWVIEKLLGLFGIEVEGVGDKILEKMKGFFDFAMDFNPFKPMWDFVDGFFSTEGTFLEKIKGGFASMLDGFTDVYQTWIQPIVDTVFPIIKNFFVNLIEGVTGWLGEKLSKIPMIGGWLKEKFGGEDDKKTGTGTQSRVPKEYMKKATFSDGSWSATPTTDPTEIMRIKKGLRAEEAQLKQAEIAKQNEWKANLAQMIEEGQKKKESNAPAINKILSAIGSMNRGGGGGDMPQQIPDEIDNNLLGMGAYSGGMD